MFFLSSGAIARGLAAALLLGLVLVVVSTSVGQVWALTVTPPSPTAGQSFTISGTCVGGTCGVYVWSVPECTGFSVVFVQVDIPLGPYSVTVPGQPAGSYSAYTVNDASMGCVNFTVGEPPPPTPTARMRCNGDLFSLAEKLKEMENNS